MPIRLKSDALDRVKADRHLSTDEQLAALLHIDVPRLDALRNGAPISFAMASTIALVQGDGFNLAPWIEQIPARETTAA